MRGVEVRQSASSKVGSPLTSNPVSVKAMGEWIKGFIRYSSRKLSYHVRP